MNLNRFKTRILNVLNNSVTLDDDNIKSVLIEAICKLASYAPIVGLASSQKNLLPAITLSRTFFIPEIAYIDIEHNIPVERGLENALIYFAATSLTHSEKKQENLERKAIQMAQEYNWSIYNILTEAGFERFYDYDEKILAIIAIDINSNICFLDQNGEIVFYSLVITAIDNFLSLVPDSEEINIEYTSFWNLFCEYQEEVSNKKYLEAVITLDQLFVNMYQEV